MVAAIMAANNNAGNVYLGEVNSQLYHRLVNAVGISRAWNEVASRANFTQHDIFNIEAQTRNDMERSKILFDHWRLRMPTMQDVAAVMLKDPPIFDAVDALRQYQPQLLDGWLPGSQPTLQEQQSLQQQQQQQQQDEQQPQQLIELASPDVTSVAGNDDGDTSTQTTPELSPKVDDSVGPQQTFPPQLVLKGLTVLSFNSEQVVPAPQRGVPMGVEVRGNLCQVRHMNVLVMADGSTSEAVEKQIKLLQELRHPSLVCPIGYRLHSEQTEQTEESEQSEPKSLSLDLFLPAYRRTLAQTLGDRFWARRLTMQVRAGQLSSLMSAVSYLHTQQPPLMLCGAKRSRLNRLNPLSCQSVAIDGFARPVICSIECAEEFHADAEKDPSLRDFTELYNLSVVLVSGRFCKAEDGMDEAEMETYKHYRNQLVKKFLKLDPSPKLDELLNFEEEQHEGFIDPRLVNEPDEDDGNPALRNILHCSWNMIKYALLVATGRFAPDLAIEELARLAITIF